MSFLRALIACACFSLTLTHCAAVHLARTAWHERSVASEQQPPNSVDDASHLNRTSVSEVVDVDADDTIAIEQIRAAMVRARATHTRISIAGFRHSMGGQTIAANGIVLNMLGHDRMELRGDVLHVQSGAVWKDIIEYLDRHGRSVSVMQSDSPFSVGGSLSVNCHGWQHLHEPAASTVRALTVLQPNGDVTHCTRTENARLFTHVLGGYGLFGVILDAELETVPNERYRAIHESCDVASYERVFDELVRENSNIGMAYGRISVAPATFLREAAITAYERDPGPLPPLGAMHDSRLERLVFRGSAGSAYGKNLRWRLENRQARRHRGEIVSRNQLLHQTIDVYIDRGAATTDILHEYFVPRGKLADFIERIRPLLLEHDDVDLLNITVRDLKRDTTTALPYAREDVFAVVMFFSQRRNAGAEAAMTDLTRAMIDAAIDLGGTYYLPYRLHATNEQFARAYPAARQFFDEKRRIDPEELLSNRWYERYVNDRSSAPAAPDSDRPER